MTQAISQEMVYSRSRKMTKRRQFAERENDAALKLYLRDIEQYSSLSREQEVHYGSLSCLGDQDARRTLFLSNLRLSVKLSLRFIGAGLPRLDLIQEGNLGLAKAIKKYDPTKGEDFSSYASFPIRQHMERALADQSRGVSIPIASAISLLRLGRAKIKQIRELGRDPTDEELSSETSLSIRAIENLRKALSCGKSICSETGEELFSFDCAQDPFSQIQERESLEYLAKGIEQLDEREIISRRAGLNGYNPQTLDEIGKQMNLTRERVRQIEKKTLKKLRYFLRFELR